MPTSSLLHLYLSPHPDDAVYSAGGLLHKQAQAGARVVVVTVCTGSPPPGPLSPFAQSVHERWAQSAADQAGLPAAPAEVVALRRQEDLAALSELGAEAVHLDVPDCLYRLNPATNYPMYTSEAALFGPLHPSDSPLIRRVAGKLNTLLRGFGRHHLYVPLGIGQHVDHLLTRKAAESLGAIYAYYEDFPYVVRAGDRWPNLRSPLLEGRPLNPELMRLSEPDIDAWVNAAACYASQLSTFWADRAALAAACMHYAERAGGASGGPAIRLWRAG
jgi:LmbE family N-acetylglucosaminyl deacetylase